MRLRKVVETLWGISPLPGRCASRQTARKSRKLLAKFGFSKGLSAWVPCSRFLTYDCQKSSRRFGYPSTDSGGGVHSAARIESKVNPTEEVANGNSGSSR